MSFAFPLPTTGSLRFHETLVDPGSRHARDLQRATVARSAVRSSLKRCHKAKDLAQKDWASVQKTLLDYLPHLHALEQAIGQDALIPNSLSFSWRPVLSSQPLRKSKRVVIASLHFDLAFCLLTLGLVSINLASRLVTGLGNYEHQRNTSESERKRLDEQLNHAADMLCRAAGIFDYVAQELLPRWDQSAENQDVSKRPVDLSPEVLAALSSFAMAEAEALALRRLLSKAAADIALSPGPPLPRSHPSPALLSKLQLNIHTLLDTALQHTAPPSSSSASKSKLYFKKSTASDSSSGSSNSQEVWPEWRHHLRRLTLLSAARSHKWLGVEAGEATRADVGAAIAWLKLAQTELSDLASPKLSSLASRAQKGSNFSQTKAVISAELDRIQAFYKVYRKMNDTVMFQPVPPSNTLLSAVPSGRAALQKRVYQPPEPAFLVSSERQLPEAAAPDLTTLSLQDSSKDSDSSDENEEDVSSDDSSEGPNVSKYALAERYY